MRASGRAAVGVVAEGVDVHATLSVGVLAGDVPGDGGGSRLGLLYESHGPGDLGVTTDDGNYKGGWLTMTRPRTAMADSATSCVEPEERRVSITPRRALDQLWPSRLPTLLEPQSTHQLDQARATRPPDVSPGSQGFGK